MSLSTHRAVMLQAVREVFPKGLSGVFFDGTVGGASMAEAILSQSSGDLLLLASDLNEEALERSRNRLQPFGDRVRYLHGNYSALKEQLKTLGIHQIQGALVDLGISSDLLGCGRGFSFENPDEPLDMRMNQRSRGMAREVLAVLSPREIEVMLEHHADVTRCRELATSMHVAARESRLNTVGDLVDLIGQQVPTAGRSFLARIFQALRIQVNDELGSLERFLEQLPDCLAPGARVAILSFHSLEDRIVKRRFREWVDLGWFHWGTRKPLRPSPEEIRENPRARSARLRHVEKAS